ncbi:hypothetical protein GYA49_04435 [Candidatus Beckwithbacteria bacterium]|nr:hypothetical protein [Candidatus Beckwithbacteria bacterium]
MKKRNNKLIYISSVFAIFGLTCLIISIVINFQILNTVQQSKSEYVQSNKVNNDNSFAQPDKIYDYNFFNSLNIYNDISRWQPYTLKLFYDPGSTEYYEKYGYLKLKIPLNVAVEEKLDFEYLNSLTITKGNSSMVIGTFKQFSTSGTFYCINCHKIASFYTQILGDKFMMPVIEEQYKNKIRYTGMRNLPYNEYAISILADSLDDFHSFLQIAETLEFTQENSN